MLMAFCAVFFLEMLKRFASCSLWWFRACRTGETPSYELLLTESLGKGLILDMVRMVE
jgi:hypothetical protein